MRNILVCLAEIRKAQLEKAGAQPEKLAEVDEKFRFMDMGFSGYAQSDKFSEVMTTGDFPLALGEFIQRQMIPAYTTKRFNFEAFVKPDTAPNFLPVNRYQRRSGLDDLEYVGEKGIPRTGSVDDATKRQYRVYKWEKEFDFSMEAIANDDMGYFSDFAASMGEAARRTLEKYVSRMLWNATTLARLVGLGANFATTGRLTAARVSDARMALNQRVDARGEPISAALKYIVIHPGLVDTAETILNSTLLPGSPNNDINVVAGRWTAIEDPYCPGASPNLRWMGLADYRVSGVVPFVLARRQGVPAPLLLRKRSDMEMLGSLGAGGAPAPASLGDFTTENITVKIHDEWGTYVDTTEGNLFDYNGAYYSSGTVA